MYINIKSFIQIVTIQKLLTRIVLLNVKKTS